MDMVDLDVAFQNVDLSPFTQLPDDIPQRSAQLSFENLETVFGAPYDMVFTFPYSMC